MKKKISTSELAEYIAMHEGTSKSSAEAFVRKFFDVIENGLLEDKYVKIKGFGTFKVVAVGERESVNIRTGERFQISGHTKVSFTPDNALKDLVNRPFAHFMAVDLNDDTETEEFNAVDKKIAEEYQESIAHEEDDAEDFQDEISEEEESIAAQAFAASADTKNAISANENASEAVYPQEVKSENSKEATQESMSAYTEDTLKSSSDIIPISSGESKPTPQPSSTKRQKPEEQSAATTEENTINLNTVHQHQTEKCSDTLASDDTHDAEDIQISAPHPINHNTEPGPIQQSSATSMSYTYTEVPSRKKKNWWKTATITICCLLLMACCYYAGYFRLLCPTCLVSPFYKQDGTEGKATQNIAKNKASNSTPSQPIQHAISSGKTDAAVAIHRKEEPSQTQTADESKLTSESTQPKATAKSSLQTGKTQDTDATNFSSRTPKEEKPQSTFHKVKPGENLTRIVRRHYGSESYVNMVIKKNHLKDANNVTVGMILELPPKK